MFGGLALIAHTAAITSQLWRNTERYSKVRRDFTTENTPTELSNMSSMSACPSLSRLPVPKRKSKPWESEDVFSFLKRNRKPAMTETVKPPGPEYAAARTAIAHMREALEKATRASASAGWVKAEPSPPVFSEAYRDKLEKELEAVKAASDDVMHKAMDRIIDAHRARRIKSTKENAEKLMRALDLAATHLQLFIETGSELEWESTGKVLTDAVTNVTAAAEPEPAPKTYEVVVDPARTLDLEALTRRSMVWGGTPLSPATFHGVLATE